MKIYEDLRYWKVQAAFLQAWLSLSLGLTCALKPCFTCARSAWR